MHQSGVYDAIIPYNCIMYSWQQPDWPIFYYDSNRIAASLKNAKALTISLLNSINKLSAEDKKNYLFEVLIQEAVSTSAIEEEHFNSADIYASIINNLSLCENRNVRDRQAIGIGKLTTSIALNPLESVSEALIKYWHQLLFSETNTLKSVGDYRRGNVPMQIISGPSYHPTIHYEAPPSSAVPAEMQIFFERLETHYDSDPLTNILIRSGIAHLHFESIHPFEDGNGRIGRAIIDQMLSRSFKMALPFSISWAFEVKRTDYYIALSSSQRSLDASAWLRFYFEAIYSSVKYAGTYISFVINKMKILEQFSAKLNARQLKAVKRLFNAGPAGFIGGLSTKNYMRLTRTPRATATRDLGHLVDLGVLRRTGAGRGTRYELKLTEEEQ